MKLAVGLALLMAGGAASAEHFSDPGVTGFVVGYEAANAEQSIRELIPQGETVQDWSRMITDQRFAGLVRLTTPKQFAGVMTEGLEKSCPGGMAGPIAEFKRHGRPAATMRADCPRNPATGKPETFLMVLIAGEKDLHARQVAFRKLPDAAETKWAEDILARTRLCVAGQKAAGC
jgi:hypothetical protein